MIELDIVERLRGKVRVPVTDGAGLLDGKDFFERSFPTSKAAMEAADEIESLRLQLANARRALAEALAVIEDCVGYEYSGDPWEENAFDMGELEIHDYASDGRLEKARALLRDLPQ